jgi:hypothetical protein
VHRFAKEMEMSAKQAAKALMKNDCSFNDLFDLLEKANHFDKRECVVEFLESNVKNTWTLALASESANATEEQVIAAILYELRMGTTCVCRGMARNMFA